MKLLITGATGLVGGELLKICREEGIPVNYLTTRRNKIQNGDNLKGFYWNPQNGEIDLSCFEGVTTIINLAGASVAKRWTAAYKKKIVSSRVDSLRTLRLGLAKSGKGQVSSLISASAIGIYPSSFTEYYTEKAEGEDTGFLGQVVASWEEEALKFETLAIKTSLLRIGLVLSEKGGALPQIVMPIRKYVGAAMGSGEQWQSWIHIEDLARMIIFLAQKEGSGVFNAVAPNPVTNKRLTRETAKVFKRPLWLPNIPQFVMKIVLGEMSSILFASQRVSSQKIEKHGFNFHYQNICRALEDLYQKWGEQ
ncbi:TIGR01777 family oxidoreductase [Lentiprolixibacter aurantiacus]|uniref:TIGR01777 family oxidoreductase n=1 Tax=Lentiprolixibacter aurantiacus TaxID=2993939 RepID=A0AAE3SP70_9FLAO|nr:TIGR01777 family oxidoreductase [Lentiprolixibacter aurantiacus]MCX2720522.1 TIGR01777 family oxidoreductase [Lentiprolixibacter aurantiacus]